MLAKFLLGFLLLFFSWPNHGPSASEFYRWLDDTGTIHLADNPQSIPERYRSQSPQPQLTLRAPVAKTDQAPNSPKFIINLKRNEGRLLVDGSINHHSFVRFIVDTGSSMTIIPTSVAARLGLNSKGAPVIDVQGVGGGIDGRLLEIDSLRIGNAEARNFDVVVIGDSLRGMGLLGADFLSRFRVHINYTREQLVLHPSEGPYDGYPAAWWQEKFVLYTRLKRRYQERIKQNEDHLRTLGINPAQRNWAVAYNNKVNPLQPIADEIKEHEHYLRTVERKISDLRLRADRATLPLHLRD